MYFIELIVHEDDDTKVLVKTIHKEGCECLKKVLPRNRNGPYDSRDIVLKEAERLFPKVQFRWCEYCR